MATHSRWMTVSLSRGLGLLDVTMIGVGAMIGAGIFGLTGIAAGEAGPVGLLLAFFLNGVVTSLTGMTYAELGAAYPEAGGGYAWVREALSRLFGFYSGWISWFSHSVACSLYAVLFGTFFAELLKLGGVHWGTTPLLWGLTGEAVAAKVFAALIAFLFIIINVRGSSETGTVGNIVTTLKILVLSTLVLFGLRAMVNMPNWADNFLANPLPHGMLGVVLAMGLTFVAFEGYEVIAQSGEEVRQPERNIPRAIFLSIAIVVAIYLSVGFVAVGALVQDSGLPNWMYLGQQGERAMIATARAIMPYGALIMILGGLASTISALNATIYSSSRVSYAMGRDGDLPTIFGRVHSRNKTPHWAIWISGLLIILMAVALPIADVASGASITFLLLFLLVNVTLIRMRQTHPDMPRPFKTPLVPWLQYGTIAVQLVLAVELFNLSPVAWVATLLWLLLGVPIYLRYGARRVADGERDTVLLEETIAGREYSVMVPVADVGYGRALARIGSWIARANGGELFALHVIRVPQPIGLSDGRAFLKHGRPLLEEVVEIGQQADVPVRTMLRLGRDIAQSIISAAQERDVDLILLGWPGTAPGRRVAFGSIIDLITTAPPSNLAVVRLRRAGMPRRILVPVAGGPNTRLALGVALTEAEGIHQVYGTMPEVIALHLVPPDMDDEEMQARRQALLQDLELDDAPVTLELRRAPDVAEAIITASEETDQIVIGASEEGILEQRFFGSIPQRVAEESVCTVIMVKEYHPVKFGLRRWLYRSIARRQHA